LPDFNLADVTLHHGTDASELYESEWETVLRNHRKDDATVGLLEPMTENWEILSSSHSFKKIDAFTIRFDVKIPKDKEIKIRLQGQIRFVGTDILVPCSPESITALFIAFDFLLPVVNGSRILVNMHDFFW
jgi:hypothetical protein